MAYKNLPMETSSPKSEREIPACRENAQVIRPEHAGARILLHMEPGGKYLSMPRPKTARQLLQALNLAEEGAIVARNGKLLTPDRQIWPDDEIFVRLVSSRG